MRRFLNRLILAGVIFIFAWYISSNWYQLMLIQGKSMEPAYHNFQLVVLDKHNKEYCTDDVIAFKCDNLSSILVKRIVAMKGDTVQIMNGKLYINGKEYVRYSNEIIEYAGVLDQKVKLQEDEIVVIGDNLAESKDSRYEEVGIVYENSIVGIILNDKVN